MFYRVDPAWLRTHYVGQAGIKFTEIPCVCLCNAGIKSENQQARLRFLLIICMCDRNREKKEEGWQEGRDLRQRELKEQESGGIV